MKSRSQTSRRKTRKWCGDGDEDKESNRNHSWLHGSVMMLIHVYYFLFLWKGWPGRESPATPRRHPRSGLESMIWYPWLSQFSIAIQQTNPKLSSLKPIIIIFHSSLVWLDSLRNLHMVCPTSFSHMSDGAAIIWRLNWAGMFADAVTLLAVDTAAQLKYIHVARSSTHWQWDSEREGLKNQHAEKQEEEAVNQVKSLKLAHHHIFPDTVELQWWSSSILCKAQTCHRSPGPACWTRSTFIGLGLLVF